MPPQTVTAGPIVPDAHVTRELLELRLPDLTLDPDINRHVLDKWVQTLADKFNPLAFGLLLVWRMPDGTLVLIDGQHRKLAAALIGYDEPVPAYVYNGLTHKTAAELFLDANEQRNVSPIDKFRKAVIAEHGTEVAVDSLLRSFDLKIGYGVADVGSPNEMKRAYVQLGHDTTVAVVATLTESFRDVKRADALSGEMVATITTLVTRYGKRGEDFDLDRLRDVFVEATLGGVLAERDTLYKSTPGKTRRWHLANAIVKLYNDAQTRAHKVTPWGYFA